MNYTRHSPSSLNLFASCVSMFVLERIVGLRQPVGPAAWRGTAVEAGVAHGLVNPDAFPEDCVGIARKKFAELAGLDLSAKRDKIDAGIKPMVERALKDLRPYGVPDELQGFIEWRPEGLKYPIVGYFDFKWSDHQIIVDLKTTERLPSEIKPAHARQVASYVSGNQTGRLAYVTPIKSAVYQLENIEAHRECLHRMAMACERFLALSDDPADYVAMTVPDLDSFYFNTDGARKAAWDVWKI